MIILVLNSGSSSLKYQLRDSKKNSILLDGIIERIGISDVMNHYQALDLMYKKINIMFDDVKIEAVGHRVVHGGEIFKKPVLINKEIISQIEKLSHLAPLHNPVNTLGIRYILDKFPTIPQVAVFDTSFHGTLPEKAWRYSIPVKLYEKYGIRKYGFHGTSHEFVAQKTAKFLKINLQNFCGVIAHIGNGASVSAIKNGKSVDTSMGFTPLSGLTMGTRSGDFDPSILIFLAKNGYKIPQLDNLINKHSGYLGLSGYSDMRSIVQEIEKKNKKAIIAMEIGAYNLAKYIASYYVVVNEMKSLVFTAGIGENSALFREYTVKNLTALGFKLDNKLNKLQSKEIRTISHKDSSIPILVVPTNEEEAIANIVENSL